MKILLITTYFFPDKFGGAERVVFELAKELSKMDQDVTVLTHLAENTERAEWMCGFRVLRYPVDASSRTSFYKTAYKNSRAQAKELLADEKFDIVHTHQFLSALGFFFPRAIKSKGVVNSFYAPYHLEFESKYLKGRTAASSPDKLPMGPAILSFLLKKGDRLILKKADASIVLSRFSFTQAAELLQKTPENIHVIPAGVDVNQFKPPQDKTEIKRRLELPMDRPILFSVRRLVERMGLEDLISAAGLLAEEQVPFLLAIGGHGPLESALKEQAVASPAKDHIRFLGAIPEKDLPLWHQACDLFVLPTKSLEGFGMVTLEAMASGNPVAGTMAGATSEILEQLDKDLLFSGDSPSAMANWIKGLLSDPDKLKELGLKAREVVMNKYLWRFAAEKTLDLYGKTTRSPGVTDE